MDRRKLAWFVGRLGERKTLSFALVTLTLALGILIGTMISTGVDAAKPNRAAPDAKPLVIPDPVAAQSEFSKISEQVRPSVVHIRVESLPKRAETGSPGSQGSPGSEEGMEDFFRRFFGLPEGPGGPTVPQPFRRRDGQGSGVIVDENGYIITNKHVVEEADRIRVSLGEEDTLYDAELIGSDEETDLAVLKVKTKEKLRPAKIGNSNAVDVGDWAIAIGSPFGFRESVTVGIISAKAREVQGGGQQRPFQKFLQTDAAINPGNSGGPLVNIRGEVIGINTAIVTRSTGYQGLGFALASNIAVDVYTQIIERGRVSRGSIGISFRGDADPALLRTYGAEGGGVFVHDVLPKDGPAGRAGIKAEDVIVEIGGDPVANGDQLIAKVASIPVGETVPIVVLRNGERMTFQVEVADREELFGAELGISSSRGPQHAEPTEVLFGIHVQELTAAERERLQFKESGGVLVTDVEPASFAEDIGIQPQDVIVEVNRRPVSGLEDIRRIQANLKPGDDVVFKVMTQDARGSESGWFTRYPAGRLPELPAGEF